MQMKRWGLLCAVTAVLCSNALATITFQESDTLGVNVFQQTTNNPCVIGDPSCKQPSGMFYNIQSGAPGTGAYDLFSTIYQAQTVNNYTLNQIPLAFTVGVDDNFSSIHEHLVAFNVWNCAGPVSTANSSSLTGPPAGCTSIDQANSWNSSTPGYTSIDMSQFTNGNGFSNFLLLNFSLTAGHYYAFEASVINDNDGMEEFFLIKAGNPPATPEPLTAALMGTGLIGLGIWKRRQNKKQ